MGHCSFESPGVDAREKMLLLRWLPSSSVIGFLEGAPVCTGSIFGGTLCLFPPSFWGSVSQLYAKLRRLVPQAGLGGAKITSGCAEGIVGEEEEDARAMEGVLDLFDQVSRGPPGKASEAEGQEGWMTCVSAL